MNENQVRDFFCEVCIVLRFKIIWKKFQVVNAAGDPDWSNRLMKIKLSNRAQVLQPENEF